VPALASLAAHPRRRLLLLRRPRAEERAIELFKIKKLIKSLQRAKGCVQRAGARAVRCPRARAFTARVPARAPSAAPLAGRSAAHLIRPAPYLSATARR
jgi:hypothetical protein